MIESGVVALLTCLALATPAMARPTLPFGVQVAAARVGTPEIAGLRRIYTRLILAVAVVAAVLTVALQAGPTVTAMVVGIADMALYYGAYRRMRAIKRREWWQAEHRHGVTVDTTFRTNPVRVPILWLLPAVLVLLVTLIIGWSRDLEPVLAQAWVVLLTPLVVLLIVRARPDLDAAKPAGSARRYRVYLRGVARVILVLATGVNIQIFVHALQNWNILPSTAFWTIAGFVPAAMAILGFLVFETRVGQAGHRLPALPGEEEEDTGVVQRDDDRYWYLAGMIYANHRDRAVLVHRRVGVYWTLNIGHPAAWVLIAAIVVTGLLSGFGVIDLPERSSW
jgi:uncharacterized membrane protein